MLAEPLSGLRDRQAVADADFAEAALVRAARDGDRAALGALLARHEPSLQVLCRGILRHPEDARDAVQETFLRAVRALPRFRGRSSARTWLSRIALNVCLEWRRTPRGLSTSLDESLAAPGRGVEGSTLDRLAIEDALAALPLRQRTVLLLKVLEGWSVAEIAAALRCTSWQVYGDLRRAYALLAEWRRRSGEE